MCIVGTFLPPPSRDLWQRQYVCWSAIHPSVNTHVVWCSITFLVEGFQWNLSPIFITWVGIAVKISKFMVSERSGHAEMTVKMCELDSFWTAEGIWTKTYIDCQLMSVTERRRLRLTDIDTCLARRTNTRLGDRSFAAVGPRICNSLQKHKFHWDQFPRNFLADLLATSPTSS